MQTPEPEPSGKGKLKVWQFSLRSLMFVMGGVALFLGLTQTRLFEPVFKTLSLLVFFFQYYLLLVVVIRGGSLGRWPIIRGIGVCLVPAFLLAMRGEQSRSSWHTAFIVFELASLLAWPSLGVVLWVVRRTSSAQDWQTVRRLSALHLLIETSCLAVVFLASLLEGKGLTWNGFAETRYGGNGGGVLLIALLANSIPLVLWLSLFSPWRNLPKRTWPDSIFRWLVAVCTGIAVVSCLYTVYLATNRERLDEYYSSRGEYTFFWYQVSVALFFWLPQVACSALFAVGVIGQLFRARQDRLLIALGCAYFVPFWLILLVAPRVASWVAI